MKTKRYNNEKRKYRLFSLLCFTIFYFTVSNNFAQTDGSVRTLTGHNSAVTTVSVSPDGKWLVSGATDGKVFFWDITRNSPNKIYSRGILPVHAVCFSNRNDMFYSGGMDKFINEWTFAPGKDSAQLFHNYNIVVPATQPPRGGRTTGRTTVTTPTTPTVNVIPSSILDLEFCNASQTLASANADNNVRIWNINTKQPIMELKGHSWTVTSLAFSPDGRYLVSGSTDKTVIVWDIALKKSIDTLLAHTKGVNEVIFSVTGDKIISCGDDNKIFVWNTNTHQLIRTLETDCKITALASSPKFIIAAGETGKIWLWEADTQKKEPVLTLTGHNGKINQILLTENFSKIISAGNDGTIKFWNIAGMEARLYYAKEIETELRTNPLYSEARGEFENDLMYAARLLQIGELKQKMYEDYGLKYALMQAAKIEQNREKIKNSYRLITLRIEKLGYYNANTEKFPITINGVSDSLTVPIAEAQSFKINYLKAKVTAAKQLLLDGITYDIFNIQVEHPITKELFPFGMQREPYYLEVIEEVTPNNNNNNNNSNDNGIRVLDQNEQDPFYDPDANG